MPIKTQSAKSKGRKLQQFVASLITEVLGLEEGDVVSRPMGSGGVDILMSPHARSKFPVSIEAKNTKRMPSVRELKQARANAYPGTLSAVVWKPFGKEYSESMIIFNMQEFVSFWSELVKEEERGEE